MSVCLWCKPASRQASLPDRKPLPPKPSRAAGLKPTSASSLPPQLWPVFSSSPNKRSDFFIFSFSGVKNVFLFSFNFFQVKTPFLALASDLNFSSLCSVSERLGDLGRPPLLIAFSLPPLAKILSCALLAFLLTRSACLMVAVGQEMGACSVRSVCPHCMSLENGSSHTPFLFYISFSVKIFLP